MKDPAVERLKSEVSLLEHIQKALWQEGKSEIAGVRFKAHPKDKTPSLLVYKDESKWYWDFSESIPWSTIIDFEMSYYNLDLASAIKKLCDMYNIHDEKKADFEKAPKRWKLVEDFENYRLTWWNKMFARFLATRWVSSELITKYKDNLQKLATEFWQIEGLWVDENKYKDCMIFPCYWVDEDSEKLKLVWAKLRRADGEEIKFFDKNLKSIGIWKPKWYKGPIPFSNGIICRIEDLTDEVLIVEWETDYTILKMLWFSSLIGNLWGVSANAEHIQRLVKHRKRIVCLYDNDKAWNAWAKALEMKIWKPIRRVIYPEIEGLDKYDINDLFKHGWRENDFLDLINKSEILKWEDPDAQIKNRFIYLDYHLSFYDIKSRRMVDKQKISDHLLLKPKEVLEMRGEEIDEYEDLCYRDWGKKWFFNTLDKSSFISPSNTPELHPDIERLIGNLCNHNNENIEYLHRAILYKYTHLNDVLLPAIVFFGPGGSGKWTFIKLLWEIFGKDNMQEGLGQKDIESDYTSYNGEKLIVEFREINTGSKFKDLQMLDRLKSIIGESRISINPKYGKKMEVDNIAWFILSSNHTVPIQLDSIQNGNRRFSIIRTGSGIQIEEGKRINATIKEKGIIANYLAWLYQKYSDVPNMESMPPLDNQEKRNLEMLCETVWNLFFSWLEEKYPYIYKITNSERDILISIYRDEISDNEYWDSRYKITNFNSGLSHKYNPQKIRVGNKIVQWYQIEKTEAQMEAIKKVNPDGVFCETMPRPKTAEEIAAENTPKKPF